MGRLGITRGLVSPSMIRTRTIISTAVGEHGLGARLEGFANITFAPPRATGLGMLFVQFCIYTHMYIHVCVCVCVHTCVCACVCVCVYACKHTHAYVLDVS